MFQPSLIPEDLGVPLMDFAKWVGHLKPGRIVYASPNASSNWDLLLRLNWSEIGGGRVWKGACSARFGKRPSFWDPLRRQSWRYVFFPQNFPRSVVIISFHSAKNQEALITVPHFSQDYWKKWVFSYFPAECGIWSWCFLFVILILNLCLHTLHTSFSACLTFCIVHLLTDSLCKVVLLIVSPYKKGPWRSGHPTIHMESPLTSFVYSYPLQTTNSAF